MRKLKLQVQVSVDGFMAGPKGEMDWMVWNWDEELKAAVGELTKPVDCILLGRALAEGFIPHWEGLRKKPDDPDFPFARRMCEIPKKVFSRSLTANPWPNADIVGGELVAEVEALKRAAGGDIIVYGGSTFVRSLSAAGLIDEYNLFVNPSALGGGLRVFDGRRNLRLAEARAFPCGIVRMRYLERGE